MSRQPFSEYWPSYQRILSGGMEIHFLSNCRVLKPNHTFVDVLQIGVEIDRGNLESQMKSQRLGAVWGQKKHHSQAGMGNYQQTARMAGRQNRCINGSTPEPRMLAHAWQPSSRSSNLPATQNPRSATTSAQSWPGWLIFQSVGIDCICVIYRREICLAPQ